MRAIGYIRVSTEKQKDFGVSLEAQEKKIRAMAQIQENTPADELEIFVDDQSGKDLNRPGMEKLLERVREKSVDVVIVAKLDRLTRSVKDLAELLELFQKKDVSLVSVNESLDTKSAAGRLVLNVMASVSQWEREVIGERTREALAHKKANGERVGKLPYGWKVGVDRKHLFLDAEEQRIIQLIRDWIQEKRTFGWIARELNDCGYRTRAGSRWRKEYVRNIFRVRRNHGIPNDGGS